MTIEIAAQGTPNPNTLKFIVNQILLDFGVVDFSNAEKAIGSPLAEKLFALGNVSGVMVGINFISVTKADNAGWDKLGEAVVNTIRSILAEGGKLLDESASASHASGSNSDVEEKIKEILDREIRPAVAMDGGDITFHSFENGVVKLNLRGACSSCPSATMTLKMGVEARLMELIPEVREVVQV